MPSFGPVEPEELEQPLGPKVAVWIEAREPLEDTARLIGLSLAREQIGREEERVVGKRVRGGLLGKLSVEGDARRAVDQRRRGPRDIERPGPGLVGLAVPLDRAQHREGLRVPPQLAKRLAEHVPGPTQARAGEPLGRRLDQRAHEGDRLLVAVGLHHQLGARDELVGRGLGAQRARPLQGAPGRPAPRVLAPHAEVDRGRFLLAPEPLEQLGDREERLAGAVASPGRGRPAGQRLQRRERAGDIAVLEQRAREPLDRVLVEARALFDRVKGARGGGVVFGLLEGRGREEVAMIGERRVFGRQPHERCSRLGVAAARVEGQRVEVALGDRARLDASQQPERSGPLPCLEQRFDPPERLAPGHRLEVLLGENPQALRVEARRKEPRGHLRRRAGDRFGRFRCFDALGHSSPVGGRARSERRRLDRDRPGEERERRDRQD